DGQNQRHPRSQHDSVTCHILLCPAKRRGKVGNGQSPGAGLPACYYQQGGDPWLKHSKYASRRSNGGQPNTPSKLKRSAIWSTKGCASWSRRVRTCVSWPPRRSAPKQASEPPE